MSENQVQCDPLEWEVFTRWMQAMDYDLMKLKAKADAAGQPYSSRMKTKAGYMAMIGVATYFGLRIGDALRINWSMVMGKSENDILELNEQKTSKRRKIYFNENLLHYLSQAYSIIQPVNELVPILHNQFYDPISVQAFNKKLKQLMNEYEIKATNPSSHTLRKTFAMRIFDKGNRSNHALLTIANLLNHSSTRETRTYLGITRNKHRNIYRGLHDDSIRID